MKKIKYLLFVSILGLVGCVSVPKDAFQLSPTSLQDRQIQSRFFETANEVELLSAGISVLQDMGYSVDETEKEAGVVTASKNVDATDGGQVAAAVFIALLGGGNMAIDKEQKIKVSFVTLPSKLDRSGYLARATFQRIVWNSQGEISKAQTLIDEELYEQFFSKLSKSVFLEAYKI
ncbi:hypothetical protein N9284_02950 [Halieaceae bacterium]|nr:hypothetical protein [Halieaceae bacterium]